MAEADRYLLIKVFGKYFFSLKPEKKFGQKRVLSPTVGGPRQSRYIKEVMGCMKRSNFVVFSLKNRCEVYSPWLGFVSRFISDLRWDSVFFIVEPRYKLNKSRSNPSPTPHDDKCKKKWPQWQKQTVICLLRFSASTFFRWNLKQKFGQKRALWGPRQSRFLTVGSPTVGGSPAVTLSKSGLLEK